MSQLLKVKTSTNFVYSIVISRSRSRKTRLGNTRQTAPNVTRSFFLRSFTIQVSSVTPVKAERMKCAAEIRPGPIESCVPPTNCAMFFVPNARILWVNTRKNIKSHYLSRLSYFRLVGSALLLLSILSSRHDNDWPPLNHTTPYYVVCF